MTADTQINADVRARILARFEEWLDASLQAGREPDGIAAEILAQAGAPEAPPFDDFYSMWAAVTALTQEVRLQGRAFKQIGSSLEAAAGIPEAVAELSRAAGVARQDRQERERTVEREAAQRATRSILDALLAVRESLTRGLESVRAAAASQGGPEPAAPETGLLARWFAAAEIEQARQRAAASLTAVPALETGYRLSLEKLDDLLGRLDVQPVHCLGQPFDPLSMNAVDIGETASEPEGTVLAVFRMGYRWRGEVFRPAEVKVARPPARARQDS
ncbi:MAG: nucleotide exchange factor GrpE [Bryobacterales bacterium]|nr:nucleotide exchange factor GrpE [Bryobacterales bacterium]